VQGMLLGLAATAYVLISVIRPAAKERATTSAQCCEAGIEDQQPPSADQLDKEGKSKEALQQSLEGADSGRNAAAVDASAHIRPMTLVSEGDVTAAAASCSLERQAHADDANTAAAGATKLQQQHKHSTTGNALQAGNLSSSAGGSDGSTSGASTKAASAWRAIRRTLPPALTVLIVGLIVTMVGSPDTVKHLKFGPAKPAVLHPQRDEWWPAFRNGALPQAPVRDASDLYFDHA
jgi:hypothetical protein